VPASCPELKEAGARPSGVKPSGNGCAECLRSGGTWVHLRLCLGCGHVGCCDNSPAKHATKHFHTSHHPVIRSYEPGEDWGYCYAHDAFADELRAFPGESAQRHFDPPGT
jgi:hypothetical protein